MHGSTCAGCPYHPYLRASDFGPDALHGLIEGHRVALFLDGLDEIPDALRPLAVQRVREESAGLRIVLSSRFTEYHQATHAEHLPYTAVIAWLMDVPCATGTC